MAITKTDIRTAVNNRTNRAETQDTIDEFLKAILYDVTLTGPFLATSTTLSYAQSVNSAALPSDYRTITAISGLVEKPFKELLGFINTLTTEGTPEFWAVNDKTVFIWPTPSSAKTYTVYYTQLDNTISTIALADEFEECLIQGTTWKLLEDKGMIEEAAAYKTLYDEQLTKLTNIYTR